MDFLQIFTYDFIIRALIAGVLIALCSALLGVPLVLKRYSMIGDGLAHVGFGTLALAAVLNLSPLWLSIIIVVAAAFFLLRLTENNKINGDSAIAVISSTFLAFGVVVASFFGINTDLNSYLFGSILAISDADLIICVVVSVLVLIMYVLFYNNIFAVTFDETFSASTGINTNINNIFISLLTAFTVVIGMRVMGTLLISALIIFPTIAARQICKKFISVVICSAVFSVICLVSGIICSWYLNSPVGATIVLINFIGFVLLWSYSKIVKK